MFSSCTGMGRATLLTTPAQEDLLLLMYAHTCTQTLEKHQWIRPCLCGWWLGKCLLNLSSFSLSTLLWPPWHYCQGSSGSEGLEPGHSFPSQSYLTCPPNAIHIIIPDALELHGSMEMDGPLMNCLRMVPQGRDGRKIIPAILDSSRQGFPWTWS